MVEYGLPAYDAGLITSSRCMAGLFEGTMALCNRPKEVSNWLMVEAARLLKEQGMDADDIRFLPSSLAALITMVEGSEVNRIVAESVFEGAFIDDVGPRACVTRHGLKVVNGEGTLKYTMEDVTATNP